MAPIIPIFMGHMPLEVVISHPLFMGCYQVLPCLRFLKAPICHTPLNANYVELTLIQQKTPPLDASIGTACHQLCHGPLYAFQPIQAVLLDHCDVVVALHLIQWFVEQVVEPVR